MESEQTRESGRKPSKNASRFGGAEIAAGLVRGLVFRAEARAQLSARFATRLRGSGGPLPLVGDRIEPETDDKTRRMTPEGVFFVGRAERSETLSTAPP